CKQAGRNPAHQWRLGRYMFVRGRCLLIKPASFLDQLEGREGMLGLIVIVEMPRQIRDDKQENRDRSNDPECPTIFKQSFCHVERSRLPGRSPAAAGRRWETSLIVNSKRFLAT